MLSGLVHALQLLPSHGCVLIVGAGWSAAAGLPLASELFDPFDEQRLLDWRDRDVTDAYLSWCREHGTDRAEQFIATAYAGRARIVQAPLCPKPPPSLTGQLELDLKLEDEQWHEFTLPWEWVATYIQRRLATPTAITRSYRYAPFRPALLRRTPSPEQARFWNDLLDRTIVRAIVTPSYDLTIEQTVGIAPNVVPGSPGFHYACMKGKVHPVNSPFAKDRSIDPTPAGPIPLAKLHGSLNWSLTREGVDMFADVRPALRDHSSAAIVPPLPEKHVPYWLSPVWDRAAYELREADEWVVVGYSLPPYDHQIKTMFRMSADHVAHIRIYDPFAADIAERWHDVAPNASIETFPGLTPGFYGRGGTKSGRLSRDERERRRARLLHDPRILRMMRQADRESGVVPKRVAA